MGGGAMQPDPTLGDLLRDLWRAKTPILTGLFLGLAASFAFLFAAVPHYRATMLVAPAERGVGPDIKALLPENSSFAIQYMMNAMGSSESGDFVRFEHILRAPSVAAALLKDERIAAGIGADRAFSFLPARGVLQTPEKLSAYLTDKVAIEPVANVPLRKIVYDHPDPAFAVYLLDRMHAAADGLIRQEIRNRTQARTAYLEKALAITDHPDHRRALASLLMEQEHVRMILAMDEDFAAIKAEPPAAGALPYWPRRVLIVPVFMFCGMLLAYAASMAFLKREAVSV